MTIKTSDKTSSKAIAFKAGVLASSLALAAVVAGCNQNTSGPSNPSGPGSVVTVNGEGIGRDALYAQLEANYGESAVRQLIEYSLVDQKLKADKLSVTNEEVNAAIESRKDSTPEIAQVIEGKGARLTALQQQARYEISLNKLLTKDIKATEDQVKKWFETRRKYYDTPAKAKIGILLSTTKAKADTMAAQLKNKSKTFVQLVDAQKTANDPAAGASVAESPTMITIDILPVLLKNAINALKPGQTSNVVTLQEGARTAYAILRLVQKQPAVKADYAKLKSEAEMDYKLEQVARKLNSENPGNPGFDQTLIQVEKAVTAQSGGQIPRFRQILGYITQTQSSNIIKDLRTAAKVESTDPAYVKLVESYKPIAAAPAAGGTAPTTAPKQ